MALACPRCSRSLADTAADAAFCMYCGQRLHAHTPPPESHGSDLEDGATQAFTPNDTPAEAAAEPQLTRVGGYRLVRFLGAGGMGQVYEAEAEATGDRVAVKLLSGRLAGNPQSVERFRQEGRVASQLSHPNCVFVMAADADAGRPFIVMELMPGRTLKDEVTDFGPLPVGKAVARTLDVVDGLAAAHRLGVIHRDVKPGNCFLTADDRVKVGDFGLSKSLAPGEDGSLTGSGTFLGTVLYASPEQIRGEPVGYESDVYAVCGTLYHLLTGRAPYQHDSLTAALAKAVSEPAPSVRARRPDVPRELDRIIRRGLDRDRSKRLASLDDLGDALRALQPERATPARRRLLVSAYLLDFVAVHLVLLPLEIVRQAIWPRPGGEFVYNLLDLGWQGYLAAAAYFTLFEGLAGTTPGKNLLRLRVRRRDRDGPPGLRAATVRTVVFNLLWWLMLSGSEALVEGLPGWAGWPLGLLLFAGCAAALLFQLFQAADGYRGVHDLAAGTRTVQRPRPAERVLLRSRYAHPFDAVAPTLGLPSAVGGFAVVGRLAALPDGEAWLAEDKGLGRRLVVQVGGTADEAERPHRLRAVGSGELDDGRPWTAYAAPAGAPLVDLASPGRPQPWADARPVLEQVAEVAADDPAVRLDQVWVEPTGRLQVSDFPLPTGSRRTGSGDCHPLRLVREAATALLEGAPRTAGGPVTAPLPPHATELLRPLADPAGDLPGFRKGLADTAALPPQVTSGMRAAQLGVQGLLLAFGLALLYGAGGLLSFGIATEAIGQAATARAIRDALADPKRRAELADATARFATSPDALTLPPDERASVVSRVSKAVAPGRVAEVSERLGGFADRRQADADVERRRLTRPERALLARLERIAFWADPDRLARSPAAANQALKDMDRTDMGDRPRAYPGWRLAVVVLAVPLAWAGFAGLFRGGLGFRLGGVVPVRADGRPAGRLWCGLRELVVWAPVAVLLLAGLWVQVAAPQWVGLRAWLWLLAALLLPAYVLLALRDPARPPQDRLLGTWLVPN